MTIVIPEAIGSGMRRSRANVRRPLARTTGAATERPIYLVRVRGNSMVCAGICDGDVIAVRKSGDTRSGALLFSQVSDEAWAGRAGGQAAFAEFVARQPACVAPADMVIEGVFVGMVRQKRAMH